MSSLEEMKPSQVLREAFAKFEGGTMWLNGCSPDKKRCCAVQAISRVTDGPAWEPAIDALRRVIGGGYVADWNDDAPDFSVIEQGFRDAIALAEMEGR